MRKTGKTVGAAVLTLMLVIGNLYSVQYGGSDQLNVTVSAKDNAEAREENIMTGSTEDGAADDITDSAEDAVQITLVQDASFVSGSGASVSENTITISDAGIYRLSGALESGQIYVNAGGSDSVVLVLDGVEITNENEPAIYVENAELTTICLADGSQNLVQSGEDTGGSAAEGEADESAEGGAIYARDDLTLAGTGALEVTGFINNGIQTSNNLIIEGGSITVDAVNNGIKGKDSVTLTGGIISVASGGDGIKSDDTTGDGYGVISIEGGEIQITSGGDGLQAETTLTVSDGDLQVTSGGGSADAETVSNNFGFGMGGFGENWDMEDEDAESTKGIKSGELLTITGGTISVDSYDDALHSNGTVTISGGSITAASGDDGIHADTELTITDGSIEVTQSYEGLEANQIRIGGGDIQITATDDGINANGGTDSWGFWGGQSSWGSQGADEATSEETTEETAEETPLLLITGGTIWIDAQGDGLDSNADLTIEGGTIIVDGPSDSMNGAIDYGSENGGTCTISGGTVLAIGSSGMTETFDDGSLQCSFLCGLSSNYAAGSAITISDADGNVLFDHIAARSFSSIVFSSPELEQGAAYQISIDGETTEIILTGVSTSDSGQGNRQGRR